MVRSHSRSSAMSPFDTTLSTYDFLIDFNIHFTFILYWFRVIRVYLSKNENVNLLHLYLAPPLGWPRFSLPIFSAPENYSPCVIVWRCLCDSTFSTFSRTPTCEIRTDGWTDTRQHVMPAVTSIAWVTRISDKLASRRKPWFHVKTKLFWRTCVLMKWSYLSR